MKSERSISRLQRAASGSCLSCGKPLEKSRRYCATACRQDLRRRLNSRTGLLKALNIRFATFSFTGTRIVLEVLPNDRPRIYSFILGRSEGRTPAEDFSRMANLMGNAWWEEKNRTRRPYLASQHLLKMARSRLGPLSAVRPLEVRAPIVGRLFLTLLKLDAGALSKPDARQRIKSAFRLAARRHHPDLGGNQGGFIRVHRAYEHLLHWAENPVFQNRRRFADKWFYDGRTNRWVQPAPPA